mgnify:CR=1 FL=1
MAFGDDSLMKLFRKVTEGTNPDIEIHRALTAAQSPHVAALYGWLTHGDYQLGMLQQFLRTASDGWDLAQASVRNLFAEADLHADEVGGDFAGEAARLGVALAEVHADLAARFPVEQRDAAAIGDLAGAMEQRLDAALDVVPDLAAHAAAARDATADFARTRCIVRAGTDEAKGEISRADRGFSVLYVFAVVVSITALAELGDKTMLATITLATREGAVGTWAGSTVGMVAADALAIADVLLAQVQGFILNLQAGSVHADSAQSIAATPAG